MKISNIAAKADDLHVTGTVSASRRSQCGINSADTQARGLCKTAMTSPPLTVAGVDRPRFGQGVVLPALVVLLCYMGLLSYLCFIGPF